MSKPDLVVIAALAGAHGVRGEARIKPFGDPDRVCAYGPFLNADGSVLFTPVSARPGPNGTVIARFRETPVRETLEAMKSTLLHVPRARLPAPEPEEYYHADLIGLAVETLAGEPLGQVRAVQDFGAGDILEVHGPAGLIYLPFTRQAVPVVDLAAGRIVADPPDADDEPPQGDGAPGAAQP